MNLVCFPFHDYKVALKEGFRTRDTHLMKHFSNNESINNLVVINRPTLLLEILLRKKSLMTSGDVIYNKGGVVIQQLKQHLYVIDILDGSLISPVLKKKRFIPDLYHQNAFKIKMALDFLNIYSFVTYESSPLTRHCVKELNPEKKIFDGVDNFCLHSSYLPLKSFLEKEYKELISSYEKVYFNSQASIDYFDCTTNSNVSLLANGVDFERFQADIAPPSVYSTKSKAIAVYAGKMQAMFDIKLAQELAESFPDVSFFYLGKILEGNIKESFEGYSNVTFTGDIHYDKLPAYIINADICIIPYRVEKQHGGDPIKFYEYYATGLPIVTTKIGEVSKYSNNKDIFVVERADFLESFKETLELSRVHRKLPKDLSWKNKSEEMLAGVINGEISKLAY